MLTNDVVSFEQPGPDVYQSVKYTGTLTKFIHFALNVAFISMNLRKMKFIP